MVRVEEGGRVVDRVGVDRGAFSCAVSSDARTLYVTAAHWPGGARIFDPTHEWGGRLLAVRI